MVAGAQTANHNDNNRHIFIHVDNFPIQTRTHNDSNESEICQCEVIRASFVRPRFYYIIHSSIFQLARNRCRHTAS